MAGHQLFGDRRYRKRPLLGLRLLGDPGGRLFCRDAYQAGPASAPAVAARGAVCLLALLACLALGYALAIPYLPDDFPGFASLHVVLAAGACVLLMLALLLVLLSLYRASPEKYRLLLVRWGLIVGGSGLLFLLAGMVSSALEVFFTITAALLTRRIWLTVGERQEKF